MPVGLALPSMVPGLTRDVLLAWMRGVDAGPFSVLATGERIAYPNQEMMTLLTGAATVTERVRIEATVSVAPMHGAIHLAKQAATIDVLCNGRFVLGVGVGGRDEDYPRWSDPSHAAPRGSTSRSRRCGGSGMASHPPMEWNPSGRRPCKRAVRPCSRRPWGRSRWHAPPGGPTVSPDSISRRVRRDRGRVPALRAGLGRGGTRRHPVPPDVVLVRSRCGAPARLHDYAYRYLRIFGDAAASALAGLRERLLAECGPGLPDCPRRCRVRRGDPRGDDRRPRRARTGSRSSSPASATSDSVTTRPARSRRLPRNIVTLGGHQWSRSSRKLASRSARSSK